MVKEITIDGQELKLAANAATPFRFRQMFKKDLLQILGNEEKAEAEGVETISELAFIMAKQAEGVDMSKLTEGEFYTWLESFGPMAFIENAEDILGIYTSSETTTTFR
ncbi:MAG: hypothetical protein IIX44_03965 [Clostridia bacterium]|nr:hypothetical protein [Clostridia bacterium]